VRSFNYNLIKFWPTITIQQPSITDRKESTREQSELFRRVINVRQSTLAESHLPSTRQVRLNYKIMTPGAVRAIKIIARLPAVTTFRNTIV